MSDGIERVSLGAFEPIRSNCVLSSRLEAVFPRSKNLHINYISTEPERCDSLYAQAPGQPEEATYCEKHFLLASLQHYPDAKIPVYSLEVIVYTTQRLTTIFVSKADSTGFISHAKWPEYALSPMTALASTFLRLLADVFQSPVKRLVVSLFARSQHTYLFPGSGDNQHKRILSDAALIKWWARVMDIVMDLDQSEHEDDIRARQQQRDPDPTTSQVYLRIPGCSASETKPFVPRSLTETSSFHSVALAADPFELLAFSPSLPTRCKIPHFVDDPKTRFAEELDGYDRLNADNDWYSVTSLNGFWDLMQYRQECAAGKLVGFVWGVFTPKGFTVTSLAEKNSLLTSDGASIQESRNRRSELQEEILPNSPTRSFPPKSTHDEEVAHAQVRPREKEDSRSPLKQEHAERIVLSGSEYDEAQSVLARGDFSDKKENGEATETEASVRSIKDWIDYVLDLVKKEQFGYLCEGVMLRPESDDSEIEDEKIEQAINTPATESSTPDQAKTSRKRTVEDLTEGEIAAKAKTSPKKARRINALGAQPSAVNVLSTSMIRKKPKPSPE